MPARDGSALGQQPGRIEAAVGRERVATHAELLAAGVPESSLMYRIRPGGRWQRLLPGVVLMHTGTPTARERLLGCLAYAGPQSVVTGGGTAVVRAAVRDTTTRRPGPSPGTE
jgi:hypothetical protein